MAMLAALPYSTKHYDSLPDIMDAAKSLTASGALEDLANSIGSIFIKHGMENTFGLILLHRHFDMDPTERLVEFGNVSVPWDITCNEAEMDKIQPVSWRFVDGGVVPYEFTGNQLDSLPEDRNYDRFVKDLGGSLQRLQLDQMLGLCRITTSSVDSPPTMEFTSGRANVTVPDVMWALGGDSAAVEASWQFGSQGADLPEPVAFKKCKNKCEYKANTGSHAKRHLVTNQ